MCLTVLVGTWLCMLGGDLSGVGESQLSSHQDLPSLPVLIKPGVLCFSSYVFLPHLMHFHTSSELIVSHHTLPNFTMPHHPSSCLTASIIPDRTSSRFITPHHTSSHCTSSFLIAASCLLPFKSFNNSAANYCTSVLLPHSHTSLIFTHHNYHESFLKPYHAAS